MFSQWRNVVENLAENLAQPAPQRAESQSPERPEHKTRSSLDSQSAGRATMQSSTSLAESAFSNLRKSLAAQRPLSHPENSNGRASPSQKDRELKPMAKSTLEERLRASFAIGDASTSTTPENRSHAPSPRLPIEGPSQAPTRVLSPSSTPLPDSPAISPTNGQVEEPHPIALSTLPLSLLGASDSPDVKALDSASNSQFAPDIPLPHSPEPRSSSYGESSVSILQAVVEPNALPESDDFAPEPLQPARSLEPSERVPDETFPDAEASEESQSFESALNDVLTRLTPVKSIRDVIGLRDHLQKLIAEQEATREEIKQLTGKLRTYDDRIEELRDTHRLESRSQTELVDSLRKQLEESEALLKAEQGMTASAKDEARKLQLEAEQIRTESQKVKDTAKDEEEKRVKAISLLKTVRQKLVKAEKDRDEAMKELGVMKDKEKAGKDEEIAEKLKLRNELEAVREAKQKDILGLKAHFDRELIGMREKLEKEFQARKGQYELDAMTVKATLQKEISHKNSRVQTLENSVRSLTIERDSMFDQLQMRQAELESSQSHLETQESRTSELQFQLREAEDRVVLASEELADARRELEYRSLQPVAETESAGDNSASLQSKYEARLDEFRTRTAEIEKERNETEMALNRSLTAKTQEIEVLKGLLDKATASRDKSDDELMELRRTIEDLRQQAAVSKAQLTEVQVAKQRVKDLENALQKQFDDFSIRIEQFDRQLSEAKDKELTMKASNKNLREELRKVQNSAALLERQRNPGVGYWSSFTHQRNGSGAQLPFQNPSLSDLNTPSRTTSPSSSSTPPQIKNDEEVNLEYLRNVILQFLEHKEMRPSLVKVLSVILHFTPQETRRIVAKV